MSSDEQLLAQGRLVQEYSMLQQRLVALKSEGRRMATVLGAFDDVLNDQSYGSQKKVNITDGDMVAVVYPGSQHLSASRKWPSFQEVEALVADIQATKTRLDDLTKELKALGLPMGDKR